MKKLIFFIAIILLLTSCVTRRACERKFPVSTSDSITQVTITKTVYRDTTLRIYLPGDTVERVITIKQSPNGLINSDVSYLKGDLCSSKAWVKDSKLYHQLLQPDTTWLQYVENAIARIETSSTNEKVKTIIKPVNYVTGWQWFQIWTGRALLALIFVFILFKATKFLPGVPG